MLLSVYFFWRWGWSFPFWFLFKCQSDARYNCAVHPFIYRLEFHCYFTSKWVQWKFLLWSIFSLLFSVVYGPPIDCHSQSNENLKHAIHNCRQQNGFIYLIRFWDMLRWFALDQPTVRMQCKSIKLLIMIDKPNHYHFKAFVYYYYFFLARINYHFDWQSPNETYSDFWHIYGHIVAHSE